MSDIGNMTSIADEGVFFVVTQAFSMTGGVIGLFILNWLNDNFSFAVYSDKICSYEKICKATKKSDG